MEVEHIALLISFVLMLFAILTFAVNRKRERIKDTSEDNALKAGIKESLLKVNLKLDQLCTTTNETRSDIKSLNKDLQSMDNRVSILESKIEALEKKV